MPDKSFSEKLKDAPDDPTSSEMIDELEDRAEAERQGAAAKPGDPTAEDMERLRRTAAERR